MGNKQFGDQFTLHSIRAGQGYAMSTKKILVRSFTALVFTVSPQIAAAAPGELAQVQAHLKAVSSMTANFVQTDRGGKSLNGVLTLARPGKIRFQYQKGTPILLVSDGSALTFIDYSVKQVQRWPVKNSPLGILLDPDRDMSRYARILAGSTAQSVLAEVRDPKHPEYGTITLAFQKSDSAPSGLMLMGWVSLDSQNNRTSIRLTNHRFNVPVSGEAFKWSDPRPKIRRR
jgi:outer membrane lipoprotein-sorting protein